jgi:hypothetical protein
MGARGTEPWPPLTPAATRPPWPTPWCTKPATTSTTVGSRRPDSFTRDHIEPQQYGIASSLVTFLARDPGAFAEFVQSIKEGMPVEESLRQAYGVSLQELVAAYGRTVGLPWLQP